MSMDSIPQISAEEFAVKYQEGNLDGALLLDVREPHEWEKEHLDQFTLIPMQQIPEHLDELDVERKTYVMCAHGMRSASVTEFLQKNGYHQVVNIEGGIASVSDHLNK